MDRANIFLNEQEYNFKLINILRWKLKYENNPKEGRIRDGEMREILSTPPTLSYTQTQTHTQTEDKMVDLNSTIPIIILNATGQNTPIKRHNYQNELKN